jgi:hypothetical protein
MSQPSRTQIENRSSQPSTTVVSTAGFLLPVVDRNRYRVFKEQTYEIGGYPHLGIAASQIKALASV